MKMLIFERIINDVNHINLKINLKIEKQNNIYKNFNIQIMNFLNMRLRRFDKLLFSLNRNLNAVYNKKK
jgi:hypothetical protein